MALAPELLEILACPQCKGRLLPVEDGLACGRCGLLYPIRDDIPVMLVDEAQPFRPELRTGGERS